MKRKLDNGKMELQKADLERKMKLQEERNSLHRSQAKTMT